MLVADDSVCSWLPAIRLRLHLGRNQQRISYWITPDQRIVLLTVFRKTRMNERAEVVQARTAMQVCATEHEAADEEFDRHSQKGTRP
jgi:hypothetical protein